MIQQRAQNRQILRYSIAHNVQIGEKYKNFQHALVTLWGNYKVLGQNIHPCLQTQDIATYRVFQKMSLMSDFGFLTLGGVFLGVKNYSKNFGNKKI